MTERALRAVDLGRIPYQEAWDLQRRLVDERRAAAREGIDLDDLVLYCEHDDVVTVGRKSQRPTRTHTEETAGVTAAGIPVVTVERGGAATFHGPGQLVGYPIVRLAPHERDLHAFLRYIEQALIDALRALTPLEIGRRDGLTGVWSRSEPTDRKLASIGIACRGWVTYHGFALNLTTDLSRFALFRPCDLDAQVMASLADLGQRPERAALQGRIHEALAAALGRRPTSGPLQD